MFTTVLFLIAKTWKQPRCPSVGEQINKRVHPGKNGKLLSNKEVQGIHRTTWAKLKYYK